MTAVAKHRIERPCRGGQNVGGAPLCPPPIQVPRREFAGRVGRSNVALSDHGEAYMRSAPRAERHRIAAVRLALQGVQQAIRWSLQPERSVPPR